MLERFFIENSRLIIPVVLFVALLWCVPDERGCDCGKKDRPGPGSGR